MKSEKEMKKLVGAVLKMEDDPGPSQSTASMLDEKIFAFNHEHSPIFRYHKKKGPDMFKLVFASAFLMTATSMSAQAGSTDAGTAELARIRSEYADVLALQGTAKAEVLAIARLLRAKPEMAIDKTKAAGEYCFRSSQGTMVHYASQPETTTEDVVYEFDATGLLAAGLDAQRVPTLPALGKMESNKWYFLPNGSIDPHHQHVFTTPTIAIAVNVK